MQPLSFRPHHFLCTLCFQGKGYSPSFIKNFQQIVDRLQQPDGDDTVINVAENTDSICAPCPNKREHHCTTQEKIEKLDQAHAVQLGIQPNQQLTWGTAKARIAARIDLAAFDRICQDCSWQHLGICENMLKAHLNTTKPESQHHQETDAR